MWKLTQLLALVSWIVALAISSSAEAATITLTFDGNICPGGENGDACSNSEYIDQTYGDVAGLLDVQYANVAGNPGAPSLRFWSTDYNDLVNVAYADGGGPLTTIGAIYFIPAEGMTVTLNSFDLGAWPNAQSLSQYTVTNVANVPLYASGLVTVGTDNMHSHFTPEITDDTGLRLRWSSLTVGIDNVTVTVTPITAVPEPASMVLVGVGLVGALRRRVRK